MSLDVISRLKRSTQYSTRPRWATPVLLGGAALAAAFVAVQAAKAKVERDHPPAGKFVDVNGVRLHYIEQGQGPTVVLLHGNGVTSNDFVLSGVIEALSGRYRVIAFDRPGFGYSERPSETVWTPEAQATLLYDALHALHVEQPIVVGHSWGTLVTLAMALAYPHYVRAVGLIGGYYYPGPRLDAAMMGLPATPVIGHLWRYTLAPLLGRLTWPLMAKTMFSPAKTPERFNDLPVWMALRPSQLGASAAESALMVDAAERLSARYAELVLPVAIIAGEGDRIIDPDKHARRFHDEISHSELRIEGGAGHMAHYADPADIADAVDSLAQKAGGNSAPPRLTGESTPGSEARAAV
jgi:pimeloyl-ACP methyl ester carboxylesterase